MKMWKILETKLVPIDPLYAPKGKEVVSILRKSDNQVFQVGDECKLRIGDYYLGKITRLWKSGNQMRGDIGRMGLVLSWTKSKEDLIDKV